MRQDICIMSKFIQTYVTIDLKNNGKSPSLSCAGTMWKGINISQPFVSPFSVDRIVNHCVEVLDFQSELKTRNLYT